MKVNIDQGTAAKLAIVLENEADSGLRRLRGYIEDRLELAKPSEQLSADELQALIEVVILVHGHVGGHLSQITKERALPKLRAMLARQTDPAPNARASTDLHTT